MLGWLYGMKERVSAHFRFSFFFLEEQIAVNGLMDGLVIDVIREGVPPFQSPHLVWKRMISMRVSADACMLMGDEA